MSYRFGGSLLDRLLLAGAAAREIGGVGVTRARAEAMTCRDAGRVAKVVDRYAAWVAASPRTICPECDGVGLVDYLHVGAGCPCLTCSDGASRGCGWVEP